MKSKLNSCKMYGRIRSVTYYFLFLLSLNGINALFAESAYVVNTNSDNVSVIDTSTNTVTATISAGNGPWDVAITPDGNFAYVTNLISDNVSVIDTSTNMVTATITVGDGPRGGCHYATAAFDFTTERFERITRRE